MSAPRHTYVRDVTFPGNAEIERRGDSFLVEPRIAVTALKNHVKLHPSTGWYSDSHKQQSGFFFAMNVFCQSTKV
jgi:hypothetical protein